MSKEHSAKVRETLVDNNDQTVIASVINVTKTYGETEALRGVSLGINRGTFTLFTGASASGKTTLMSMLHGIVRPDKGDVVLFGQSLDGLGEKQINRIRRKHIGLGFQDSLLDRSHTVADVMRQTARANRLEVALPRIRYLSLRFGMVNKLMTETGSLSGGEKMRTSMMRALATEPDLILLDEPAGAVDTKGKIAAMEILRDITLEEQSTVVMITHDPVIARPYADHEFVFESGKLIDSINFN